MQYVPDENVNDTGNNFPNNMDSVPTIIWITNPEGYCTYLNKHWYTFTGQTKEEAEGFGWLDATHPEDKEKASAVFLDANAKRIPFTLLYRLLNKNGEYRWAIDTGSPKFGPDGTFEGMIGSVVDIQEQKLAEEALRKTSRHLQMATSSAAVGTWSLDLATQNLEWSGLHKKMWGYDENSGDLLYEDWHNAILEEDKQDAFAQVAAALVNRTQYENIYRIKRVDSGEIRYMRSIGQYLYDKHGQPFVLTGITTDITRQKEAEEALRYRKALLEAQNEAIPDAILVVDTMGNMLSFNRHFAKLWNIPKRIIDARDDAAALQFAMTQVEDPQGFIDGVNYCYAHPEELTHEEIAFKDGRIIERYGNPVTGEDQTHYGFIWFFRDITKRKQAEAAIRESENRYKGLSETLEQQVADRTRELHRSNEDLQQFAHVASHDLKEPVRKVETFLHLLQQHLGDSLDDKAKRYIDKIHSAASRMNTMIEGVLTYSTINAHQQKPKKVDLNQVIKNIETDLEVKIQNTHASIHYADLPTIHGAEILLYQLFYNLITNSLKFAKADTPPVITITSKATVHDNKPAVAIVLADNGIGFEPEYAEKIFDTFSRLNSKDAYDGTGLGLALCKKIVARHGGSITATAVVGVGAEFRVVLGLG